MVKHKIKSVVADPMKEITRKQKSLEVLDEKGRPIGPGW